MEAISNRFKVLIEVKVPEELRDTFKHETLQAAEGGIGESPKSMSGVALRKMLENINENYDARLAEDSEQYRASFTKD